MEARFRKRSDRPGAEPPTTESVDDRVQEEMRQFFSESTMILEEVVPSLKQGDEALADTTGEIRRKIDAFFGDSGASGMIRSERAMPSSEPMPAPVARSGANGRDRGSHAAPAEAARPRARPASGGGKMDLRTALERLRRHGIVRDEEPSFSASAPIPSSRIVPEPSREPAMARAPVPAPAPAPPPAAPAPVPAPVPTPDVAARPRFEPPPSAPAPPPSAPAAPPAAEDPFAPPPLPPPPLASTAAPPAEPGRHAPPIEPEPRVFRSPPPARPAEPLPPPVSARPEIPRVDPMPPLQDSGEGFDEIFAEVEGLVRGTLADSIQETLEEARVTEDTMRSLQSASSSARSLPTKFAPPREDDEEEDEEEAGPSGPYDWGVSAANRPAGAWLLEDGAEEAVRARLMGKAQAPGEVVGVEVAARQRVPEPEPRRPAPAPVPAPVPAPSMLLDDDEEDDEPAPRPAARTPTGPVDATPEPTGGGGGGAAAALLSRKLEAEAARLGPIVDALVAKGVVNPKDLADEDEDEFDDDDEISVADYKDNRPRGDAVGVTPMKLVEEIRRLRRIQELLMSKGLVSEDELSAPAPGDD